MPEGNGIYETTDLSVAAYLFMEGLKIRSAKRAKGSGRSSFSFVMYDPDGKAGNMILAFTNSECGRYDQALRTVKRLVFD